MLPIHKESLRATIRKGLLDTEAKICVLRMLKPIICKSSTRPMRANSVDVWSYGDIKGIFGSNFGLYLESTSFMKQN